MTEMRSEIRSLLKLGFFACLTISPPPLASGEVARFHAEGEVLSVDRLSKGVSSNAVTLFQVDFDSCKWRIRTERKTAKFDLRFDAGSSNTDIFAVTYLRSGVSTNWATASASARPGPVPFVLGDPMIQVLWIAFVSQCHYSSNGLQLLPRVFFPFSPDLNNANFQLPMDVQRNNTPPFFLSSLTMFIDGSWRFWEEERDAWVRPPLLRPLPPPYQTGFTNSSYRVDEFQTADNASWPLRFRFESYQMRSGASSSTELDTVCTMDGHVIRFDRYPGVSPSIPELPAGIMVNEERFIWDAEPVFAFNYQSSSIWPSKTEVAKSAEYEIQLRRQRSQKPLIASRSLGASGAAVKPPSKTRVKVTLCLMALVTLTPLFFVARKLMAKKMNQKQQARKENSSL